MLSSESVDIWLSDVGVAVGVLVPPWDTYSCIRKRYQHIMYLLYTSSFVTLFRCFLPAFLSAPTYCCANFRDTIQQYTAAGYTMFLIINRSEYEFPIYTATYIGTPFGIAEAEINDRAPSSYSSQNNYPWYRIPGYPWYERLFFDY